MHRTPQRLSVQVKAVTSDGERSSFATVFVAVNDINDNVPEFIEPVRIDTRSGRSVTSVCVCVCVCVCRRGL